MSHELLGFIYPNIGNGNKIDALQMQQELSETFPTTTLQLNGWGARMGQFIHRLISTSVHLSLPYSAGSAVRESLPAQVMQEAFLAEVFHWITSLEQWPSAIISPQDMTLKTLVNGWPYPNSIEFIQTYPDTRGKLHDKPTPKEMSLLSQLTHWTWVPETRDFLLQYADRVHLIKPSDPRLLNRSLSEVISERMNGSGLCFIKASGSGYDRRFIAQIITSLKKSGLCCSVTGSDKFIESLFFQITNSTYYDLTDRMDNYHLLINPSEQIKYLALLSQENRYIRVMCLPPRGRHELNNLVFAINHGLIQSVCIPQRYHDSLKELLKQSGLRMAVRLVDPDKVSSGDFFEPLSWQTPVEAISVTEAAQKIC